MRVFLVGSEGSMGKRYQAILNHLKIDFTPHDIIRGELFGEVFIGRHTHIIIATPTESHFKDIKYYRRFSIPILCESPITTDIKDLKHLLHHWGVDLNMVLQLKKMIKNGPILTDEWGTDSKCITNYDYFKSWDNGSIWNFMQPIVLHQGPMETLTVKDQSPVWDCTINNQPLDSHLLDRAYIDYLQDWFNGDRLGRNYLVGIHEKTLQYKAFYESNNRHSSTVNQQAISQ